MLIGSLRQASFSRQVAQVLIDLVPEHVKLEIVEVAQLPFYYQDFDDRGIPPTAWAAFHEGILAFAAILFVTPEYNRSVPAVLKNVAGAQWLVQFEC